LADCRPNAGSATLQSDFLITTLFQVGKSRQNSY